MLNHITIMGRLTRDPELRRTGSGIAVASFTLAVDRDYKPDGGVWKLEATRNVAGYFEKELHDLIEAGAVVVIR